jgi:hypothetical protein
MLRLVLRVALLGLGAVALCARSPFGDSMPLPEQMR